MSFQSLVYDLERIYTYLSAELGNPANKGYIPLQDRLNVAEVSVDIILLAVRNLIIEFPAFCCYDLCLLFSSFPSLPVWKQSVWTS